jgi:3-methyladenine DNA glycosylase AlkD
MRKIAKEWMKAHRDLDAAEFAALLTSLVEGESSTEKCMAGMLLGLSRKVQRGFPPELFDRWLESLEGWAEVDAVCTGAYTVTEIPGQWKAWKKLLVRFSRSKNINKRRASLVLFCSPLRSAALPALAALALQNVKRLQHEREILITKAISWVLRSAVPHHKSLIKNYLDLNKDLLPKIAVRETMTVIKTGRKTKSKSKPS